MSWMSPLSAYTWNHLPAIHHPPSASLSLGHCPRALCPRTLPSLAAALPLPPYALPSPAPTMNFLDDGPEGFSVAPKTDCPHISLPSVHIHSSLLPPPPDSKRPHLATLASWTTCTVCSDTQETWVCLRCSVSRCGRFIKAHMLEHASDRSASSCAPVIAMGMADLSAWCFECDDYITHPKLEPAFRSLHFAKFGYYPPGTLHGDQSS